MNTNDTALFYDPLSRKYFTSSGHHIYGLVNKINYETLVEGRFSYYINMLDTLRCRLGLPSISECGYFIKKPYEMLLDVELQPVMGNAEQPCFVMNYGIQMKKFRSTKKDSA